jgi:putative heme transporter
MPEHARVHPTVDRVAAYSWRFLVIGAAVYATLWLIGELLLVVIPLAIAFLIIRALVPVDGWFRKRGLPPVLAAVTTVILFLVVLIGTLTMISFNVASEFGELGNTLQQGVSDIEDWLVEDSPFDISRADVERWRGDIESTANRVLRSSGGTVASGARLAAEVVVGMILTLMIAIFLLKDRERMKMYVLKTVPDSRRDVTRRAAMRAWTTTGGFLRGAAILGVVEAMAKGIAMQLVGANLVVPVMVLTVIAAFVPIVGAIVAGVIAVLVTLVSAGLGAAVIVAIVAIVVQQLDGDVLAPVIYGQQLQLHPLTILLGITAGTALFGFVGAVLAVPVLAVVLNIIDEVRHGPPGAAVAVSVDSLEGAPNGNPGVHDR